MLSRNAGSAAAATSFCSHLKTPARITFKYMQYAYWPRGICLVILFLCSSFFNKIQDGDQNPMSLSSAWNALWICFMFSSKEIPYPGCVLISFW